MEDRQHALLFFANFSELLHIPLTGPYWSLSIEEQFYLVWPAIVRWLSPRTMRNAMLIIVIVEPLLRAVSMALGHGRIHYTFMQTDGLAWGALLAIFAYDLRIPYRNYDLARLWKSFGLPLTFCGALLIVVSEVVTAVRGRASYYITLEGATLFFAGVMTYVITHPKARITRLLSVPPLLFLGSISYMVYLTHFYFLDFYDRQIILKVSFQTNVFLRCTVTFALTLLFCTASLYLFERPINRMRRFVLKEPKQPALPIVLEGVSGPE